jgi:hypothetical protein
MQLGDLWSAKRPTNLPTFLGFRTKCVSPVGYTILDYRFPILDCRMLDQLTVLAIEIMHPTFRPLTVTPNY